MIKMVFAFEHNFNTDKFVFGKDMTLPWGHVPQDLKLFKEYTTDKGSYELDNVLVMGRKTYESIKDRGIKGREFWILSSEDIEDENNDIKVFRDFDILLDDCKERNGNVFVIGGKSLLEKFMGIAEEISVSYILNKNPSNGDVFLEKSMLENMFLKYKIKEQKLYKGNIPFIRMRLELK